MGTHKVLVSPLRISVDRAMREVSSPSAGGTVLFVGTVRQNSDGMRISRMELEAAKELAEADLRKIAVEARGRFGLERIYVQHRIGKLVVGDVIVVIAASAAHRKDAFAGCRFVIDRMKRTTPIWKKELGPGGRSRWVEQER